jgi:hypothetical protein
MKPSELSKLLRIIASKIDASKKPDRVLVARDLKRAFISIVASIDSEPASFSKNFKGRWTKSTLGKIIDKISNEIPIRTMVYVGFNDKFYLVYKFQSSVPGVINYDVMEVNKDARHIGGYMDVGDNLLEMFENAIKDHSAR